MGAQRGTQTIAVQLVSNISRNKDNISLRQPGNEIWSVNKI